MLSLSPYIELFIVTVFLSSRIFFKHYAKASYWLGFFLICLIFGSRFEVGTDYATYINLIQNIDSSLNIEPGFYITTKLFNFLDVAPTLQLGIYYVITVFFVWLSIARWSQNRSLSVAVFFGLGYAFLFTNQVRQSLAIVICLYSYRYIFEKNAKNFILCMIFALSFHYSAIVFCGAYLLKNVKLSNRMLLSMLFISLLIGFFLLGNLIDFLFKAYESYAPALLVKKYSYYFNNQFGDGLIDQRDYGIGIRFIFLNLVAIMLVTKVNRENNEHLSMLLYFSIIGICLTNMFTGIEVLSRLVYFYSIFIVIALPLVVNIFSAGGGGIKIILALSMLMFTLKAVLSNVHSILPYQTYLLL